MKNSPIAQFLGRHERILKIAMKVLVVLGVIYGAMACFGPGSQVQAADGPRVGKYTIQYTVHGSFVAETRQALPELELKSVGR